ncbi:MAG: LysM peptidoglycan-binding domain-containing protein [Anaerolineae bacterium]|nr:LysM peptidoglycan-binding domain-containing protein [Anaerolineae bacterium]
MSKKALFSKSEWQMIADGPEWVFAALAAADGNVALTVKAKEARTFKDVVKDYSSSSDLVNEVIGDKLKPAKDIKNATLSDAEQALEEINDLLAEKLDRREADQYRKFLKDVGDSVAKAAGEGLLGTGKKLSDKEAKALKKIKTALKSQASKATARPKPTARPKATRKASTRRTSARPRSREKPKFFGTEKKKEYVAEHTVGEDDTLSHIALKYYGSALKEYYMVIYEENKGIIGDNPNIIVPGQVLKIPKYDK